MAHHKSPGETPTLETLWCSQDACSLTCYACGLPIHPQPLVRTFRLQSEPPFDAPSPTSRLPALGRTILTYDRHLECARGVAYVAVSHVWNKTVSKVQNREGDLTEIEEARKLAVALPMRIYDGLSAHDPIPAGRELWHDYLSVPQWQDDVKRQILDHVASIFSQAAFTLVHLEDVSGQAVRQMRSGATLRARARGVVRICNAAWFGRVWTVMEYVRSRDVRTMLHDCTLSDGDGGGAHDVFIRELHSSWDAIVKERGDAHEAEKLAARAAADGDGGGLLLPWQLGPLARTNKHHVVSFAEAFSMLAKRGCRSNRDFFHALNGLLNLKWGERTTTTTPPPDYGDYGAACLAFARECVRNGDHTPVLMSPLSVDDNPGGVGMGYHDEGIWSLGALRCAPPGGLSLSSAGNPVLEAQRMGPVRFVKKLNFRALNADVLFSHVARVALDFTGPDVDNFVATVGTRLYGQDTCEILERLAEGGRRSSVERALEERFNFQGGQEPWKMGKTDRIADAMGLSTTDLKSCGELSPLRFMKAKGGTLHLGPRGALVGITCPSCLGCFLFRAALYVQPSDAVGAVAYRIPGLQYSATMKDGIAIIVKEDKVVGRMVWAVPTCPCRMAEEVEIQLNRFPERKSHFHQPNRL